MPINVTKVDLELAIHPQNCSFDFILSSFLLDGDFRNRRFLYLFHLLNYKESWPRATEIQLLNENNEIQQPFKWIVK